MKKIIFLFAVLMILCSCTVKEEDEATKILRSMTLEEKAAQMLVPSFRYDEYISSDDFSFLTKMNEEYEKLISRYGFGGIILFSGNLKDIEQSRKLISDFNRINEENGHLPYLICTDQEGGTVRRLSFGTYMPGNMALGANGNEEDIYTCASIMADELSSLGINTDLAPVVDINNDPDNPVIGIRSFSDDPDTVALLSKPYIQALKDKNIISTLKHFPGHGDTDADSHSELPLIEKTFEEIRDFELIPFMKGIEAGCDMVMVGHIQFPNIDDETYHSFQGIDITLPATFSEKIVKGILRDEMKFDGVVISDSLAMVPIWKYFKAKDAARLAINAGVDILLMPIEDSGDVSMYVSRLSHYVKMICQLVEEKQISESRIDEAVYRIIRLKIDHGLLSEDKEEKQIEIGSHEHHLIEMEIAENAITLIRNNDVLPLKEKDKILILCPEYRQVNSIEYAIDLLIEKEILNSDKNITIHCYHDDLYERSFRKNILPLLKDQDKILIVSSMYGSSYLNSMRASFIDRVLEYSVENDIPSILLSSELPYDLSRFESDGALACYYALGKDDPSQGYAPNLIAAILVAYNDVSPKGKLPVDIPEIILEEGICSYSKKTAYERGCFMTYDD
ncbi:MAG: hypothetical protein IKS54_09940 [Erysipelotrichaceae bacterium]|nr:hypothetical protein [Erysipelotrichaceae bacterium]